jgi:hypothetical protein
MMVFKNILSSVSTNGTSHAWSRTLTINIRCPLYFSGFGCSIMSSKSPTANCRSLSYPQYRLKTSSSLANSLSSSSESLRVEVRPETTSPGTISGSTIPRAFSSLTSTSRSSKPRSTSFPRSTNICAHLRRRSRFALCPYLGVRKLGTVSCLLRENDC